MTFQKALLFGVVYLVFLLDSALGDPSLDQNVTTKICYSCDDEASPNCTNPEKLECTGSKEDQVYVCAKVRLYVSNYPDRGKHVDLIKKGCLSVFPSESTEDCVEKSDKVEDTRIQHEACVCTGDLCNTAGPSRFNLGPFSAAHLLTIIFYSLKCFINLF